MMVILIKRLCKEKGLIYSDDYTSDRGFQRTVYIYTEPSSSLHIYERQIIHAKRSLKDALTHALFPHTYTRALINHARRRSFRVSFSRQSSHTRYSAVHRFFVLAPRGNTDRTIARESAKPSVYVYSQKRRV